MRHKLLVVDDDQAVLNYMQAMLGERYDVVTTRSAAGAVALAREVRPHAIVCDLDMPDVDGGDVSAALYADDEMRAIPLLFLTGLVSADDLARAKGQLGGRPAISKTAPIESLIARIDALING